MTQARVQPEIQRNWQSVRTVLEGLILIALCWSAHQLTETQTQIAVLQENVLQLRTQLADVPGLANRVTRNETRLDNLEAQMHDLGVRR